jgi:hypothetical protein
MNLWLWLLWGFLALVLGAAAAVAAAYGSAVVVAVFDETRARRRYRLRRAWIRRELRVGARQIARELDRAVSPARFAELRRRRLAVVIEHPAATKPRDELTTLVDATTERPTPGVRPSLSIVDEVTR